jgi:TonB family protein
MAQPDADLMTVLLRRPEPRFGLAVGFVVAVALHLLAIPGAGWVPGSAMARRADVDVGRVGAAKRPQQRVELTLQPKPPSTTTSKPKEPEPEPEPELKGQVVNLPAVHEEKPVAADYLAEHDQRTERETRARVTGLTETATRAPSTGATTHTAGPEGASSLLARDGNEHSGGPRGAGNASSGRGMSDDVNHAVGGTERASMLLPRLAALQPIVDTGSGALRARSGHDGLVGNADRFRIALGQLSSTNDLQGEAGNVDGSGGKGGSGGDGPSGELRLVPGLHEVARLAGLPRNDALLVEEDNETSLNSRAFKHATYFNRLGDAVRRVWLGEGLHRADPTGKIYGVEDRTALVLVTIDRNGTVVDLQLKDSSGVAAVDDEALLAVVRSQPYLQPPPQLFVDDDRYSFTFRFTIERGSRNVFWR